LDYLRPKRKNFRVMELANLPHRGVQNVGLQGTTHRERFGPLLNRQPVCIGLLAFGHGAVRLALGGGAERVLDAGGVDGGNLSLHDFELSSLGVREFGSYLRLLCCRLRLAVKISISPTLRAKYETPAGEYPTKTGRGSMGRFVITREPYELQSF